MVVGPVRRRALRPLVVRGPDLHQRRAPPAPLRPAGRRGHHARRLPGPAPDQPGGHAGPLLVGREGLRRVLVQRDQRLDLPARPRGRASGWSSWRGATRTRRGSRAARSNQAARELMLAQSSDWPFIMTTGSTVPYATRRFNEHTIRFTRLYQELGRAGGRGLPVGRRSPRTTSSPTSTTGSTPPDAMKVLFVSSEVAPFAKSGGLGDVAGALPKALRRRGIDVRVVLPLYAGIDWNALERLEGALTVPMWWGTARGARAAGALPGSDVPVYFLEYHQLLRPAASSTARPSEGYADNLERFTFLSRGALELCKRLELHPRRHPRQRLADRAGAGLRQHGRVGRAAPRRRRPSTPSTTWPTRASPTAARCSSPAWGRSTTTRASSSTSAR